MRRRFQGHVPPRSASTIHAVEREHTPRVWSAGTRGLRQRVARVFSDDPRPEATTAVVPLRHTHDPATRKSLPEKKGRAAAHARATMVTHDEELRDVEVV